MARNALFAGLIVDEYDHPVDVAMVGGDAFYVVDDQGFHRHIFAEDVDREVLKQMSSQIDGNENIIGEQTAKMLGQEDIFTRAMLINQLKNIEQQFEALLQSGIHEEGRAYMGMLGFRIRINHHGEILEIHQPGVIDEGGEGE